jgi:hypothetical protein
MPLLEAGKISELIDPLLHDEYDENQIKRLVQIASHCIRQPSIWRPSMSEVNYTISGKDLKYHLAPVFKQTSAVSIRECTKAGRIW